jgi:transposase-like protein
VSRYATKGIEGVWPKPEAEGAKSKKAPTMTRHHEDTTHADDPINHLLKHGLSDGLPEIAEMLMNAAMLIERSAHLRADRYERSEDRNGYANVLKDRSFHSSVGPLALRVPQTRDSDEPYRSSMLESGSRSDRSLKVAIAEMYLQGVSTRRVTKVMEKMCGLSVSSTQVSKLTAELDETFELWRNRSLPEIAHMIIDATYIKVRIGGCVRDCAVFTAIGVRRDNGKRMVLGVSAALSEAEVHWRQFLVSLKERGIGIPDSITSDAHEGIRAALKAVFNATPWQRCQFHLQQKAQAYVPKLDMREPVAADIRSVFNSESLAHAEAKLDTLVEKYSKSAPELSNWMQSAIPEGLQVFGLSEHKRKRLRTSNACETLNTQIKRRTRVAGLFPNIDSILRLVTAILMEVSEEWETGKAYITNKK